MEGEPICFHNLETGHSWYAILGVQDETEQHFQSHNARKLSYYGKTWLAYTSEMN